MCLAIWVNVSCLRLCAIIEMESLTREDQYPPTSLERD